MISSTSSKNNKIAKADYLEDPDLETYTYEALEYKIPTDFKIAPVGADSYSYSGNNYNTVIIGVTDSYDDIYEYMDSLKKDSNKYSYSDIESEEINGTEWLKMTQYYENSEIDDYYVAEYNDYIYRVDFGVSASGKIDKNTVRISGRSLGSYNIGEILGKLSGGGDAYNGAAVFDNKKISEVYELLKKAIEKEGE